MKAARAPQRVAAGYLATMRTKEHRVARKEHGLKIVGFWLLPSYRFRFVVERDGKSGGSNVTAQQDCATLLQR